MLAGQHKAAQESFESAIRLYPELTLAQSNLGVALFSQQRYQDAEILYKKILKQNPNAYYAYEGYGNVLRMQRRYNEALVCYEKAIQLKDDFIPAHTNRLYTLSYHVLCAPEEMLQAHMEWSRRFSAPEIISRNPVTSACRTRP